MLPPLSHDKAISRLVREEWGRILASLTKSIGDLNLAEDSLQDAVETALKVWPKKGLPRSPAAWLITTARRKAIDRIRRAATFSDKQADLAYLTELEQTAEIKEDDHHIPDERLEMMFTCCHPALEQKTRIALTLRTIGGLTTDEIASAFFDKPSAMAQRLSRAKQKIKQSGIPYEIPEPDVLTERLNGVLSVIYLIFNEGYSARSGALLTRIDLSNEAIRLGRILLFLMPDDAEVSGLLALMLLHDSRRQARTDKRGALVTLEDQDRSLWDQNRIEEGRTLIQATLKKQKIGPYQLQAAISALHVDADSWDETDWPQIVALYNLLFQMQPSPIVQINRAMAVSYASSAQDGLRALSAIENTTDMSGYKAYHLVKSDLLRRTGNPAEANLSLKVAIGLAENEVERHFFLEKLTQSQISDEAPSLPQQFPHNGKNVWGD